MSDINWNKVTNNIEVVQLLKEREELERMIMTIDDKALINYELEKLALPQANEQPETTNNCTMHGVVNSVCPNCGGKVNPKGIFFCSNCEKESTM